MAREVQAPAAVSELWQDLLTAFALLLVLEGILPVLAPKTWINSMLEMARMGPKTVRVVGLTCMLAGALMLQWLL